jgi:hypothetical protein
MVRSQFQGAAVPGTSIARTGEITATNGVIDPSNFHNYPVARFAWSLSNVAGRGGETTAREPGRRRSNWLSGSTGSITRAPR